MSCSPCKKKCFRCNLYKIMIYVVIAMLLYNIVMVKSGIRGRRIFYLPFSLHLNTHSLVMLKGEEHHLFVYGINKRVTFSSSNFRVAGVNFNGRVFAYRTGTAVIMAKVDKKVLRCKVRVIDINKDKLLLDKGDSYRLKIKGIVGFPKWRSSTPKVATVNRFGKVKAKRQGTTIITGKIKGRKVKCVVTVE